MPLKKDVYNLINFNVHFTLKYSHNAITIAKSKEMTKTSIDKDKVIGNALSIEYTIYKRKNC